MSKEKPTFSCTHGKGFNCKQCYPGVNAPTAFVVRFSAPMDATSTPDRIRYAVNGHPVLRLYLEAVQPLAPAPALPPIVAFLQRDVARLVADFTLLDKLGAPQAAGLADDIRQIGELAEATRERCDTYFAKWASPRPALLDVVAPAAPGKDLAAPAASLDLLRFVENALTEAIEVHVYGNHEEPDPDCGFLEAQRQLREAIAVAEQAPPAPAVDPVRRALLDALQRMVKRDVLLGRPQDTEAMREARNAIALAEATPEGVSETQRMRDAMRSAMAHLIEPFEAIEGDDSAEAQLQHAAECMAGASMDLTAALTGEWPGTKPDPMREVLAELVEWAARQGGYEAACWARAKAVLGR